MADAPLKCDHKWDGPPASGSIWYGRSVAGVKSPRCSRCGMSKIYYKWKKGRKK